MSRAVARLASIIILLSRWILLSCALFSSKSPPLTVGQSLDLKLQWFVLFSRSVFSSSSPIENQIALRQRFVCHRPRSRGCSRVFRLWAQQTAEECFLPCARSEV